MSKNKTVRNLLEMGVMAGILGLSWLVAAKLLGYPWQVGMIAGAVLVAALQALLHGMGVGEYLGGLGMMIILALLLVWNEQSAMSAGRKYAWTFALLAAPLAAYVLGRVIRKNRITGESESKTKSGAKLKR